MDRQPSKRAKEILKVKAGNLVLLKYHMKWAWNVKYMSDFRICKVINDRVYDLQDLSGHVHDAAVADIPLMSKMHSFLPDVRAFGKAREYMPDTSLMPDLKWITEMPS